MARADDEVLGFVAEWYDPMPQLTRQFLLKYWPGAHMVEMMDLKVRAVAVVCVRRSEPG